MEEGYVKYRAHFIPGPPTDQGLLQELIKVRQQLFRQGLIGVYPDGIGYGNVSARIAGEGLFVVSGTATGGLPVLDNTHFCRVLAVDLSQNALTCQGPIQASSEAMTHSAFYEMDASIGGVAHVHHAGLWEALLNKVPTTPAGISYGTPAMANAMAALLAQGPLKEKKIAVMHGHPEGIFSFGKSIQEAGQIIQNYWNAYQRGGE